MQVTLAATTFDPLGVVVVDALPTMERGDTSRRVNRVATLDGGSVFNDFGHSESDKTIRVVFKPESRDQETLVRRLVETYSQIQAATEDGVFLAAPQTFTTTDTSATLTLLVVRKLST